MANADVIPLKLVPIDHTGRPQENVIRFLEGLLARARTGEIQSITVVYVRSNGFAANGVSWGERLTDCYPMGTALLVAQHDFVCEMTKGCIEVPPPPEQDAS